jgi:hypothetical protein
MDRVIFTHLEDADDIIISLSCDEESTFGVDGFIVQRNAKYERFLSPTERGACVEWEDADDIRVLLDEVSLSRNELKIKTKGKVRRYHFDLTDISDEEYEALVKHFHLINFDGSIKLQVS